MWPSFLASLFLAFFLSLLSSTTALRILTLVDPPSPMLAGAATSLRLLLRDPMRRMQPATIDSLVPPPSLDGRAGGLVHVFAALAEPPGLAHARLVASQDAENATLFLVRTSFPVPGIYKLRARFAVLNPGTPRWDDPAAMTRTREVEMVQLGRGGEAWAVDEAADETLLEDEVEIVVGVGPIPVKEGLITDGVAVGRKDEAGWTVFGARPTPDADVRMDAKWLPRLRKPETVIDDRCNLLLVTFSRTLGKRGSETAAPIMGTDWIEPITDLISAARIGNSDVASPLHITTVSEKRIAHSNIAIPLHAVADIRTGAVPDLCTRQVMKAALNRSLASATNFRDGIEYPWPDDGSYGSAVDPWSLRFGPSFVVPLVLPANGKHRVVVEAQTASGEGIVTSIVFSVGHGPAIAVQVGRGQAAALAITFGMLGAAFCFSALGFAVFKASQKAKTLPEGVYAELPGVPWVSPVDGSGTAKTELADEVKSRAGEEDVLLEATLEAGRRADGL